MRMERTEFYILLTEFFILLTIQLTILANSIIFASLANVRSSIAHWILNPLGPVLVDNMQTPPLSLKSCQIEFLLSNDAQCSETYAKQFSHLKKKSFD